MPPDPELAGDDPGGAIETTRLPRVAGRTGERTAVVTTRPYRAPHQTISDVGLIGDGQVPRPGEGPRAYHGRLVVDARPACRRHGLEGLCQPLEEASQEHNLPRVSDFTALAVLAERVKTTGEARAQLHR